MLYVDYDSDDDVLEISMLVRNTRIFKETVVCHRDRLRSVEVDYDKDFMAKCIRLSSFIGDPETWKGAVQVIDIPQEIRDEAKRAESGWRYLYGKTKEILVDLETRLSILEIDHERDPDD